MTPSDTMPSDADPNALDIQSALDHILEALPIVSLTEEVPLSQARGRVLATEVRSPMNVPPFRSSAMDGYALRHADITRPLRQVGQSLAGHPGNDSLPQGCCQRIMTGARVPDEADTVVQQENVDTDGEFIQLSVMPSKGLNVRAIGSDSQSGSTLLRIGQRLYSGEIGLLAAHGIDRIVTRARIRIGIFSTGDELVDAGSELLRGQIHDANRPLLKSLLTDPGVEIIDLGIVPDRMGALTELLDSIDEVDILLSSGGVSVGDADHVRDAVSARGDVRIWKVAMKPGRPLAFGKMHSGQFWFGLPGNPVSSAITTLIFVRPALLHMMGVDEQRLPSIKARVRHELRKRPGRVEFQRGILHHDAEGNAQVDTTGLQDSHVLSSLSKANCLIELPDESSGAAQGELVSVHPFVHFGDRPI